MVCGGEDIMHLKYVAYSPKEVRHELRSVIGKQCCRGTVLEHLAFHERNRDVICGDALQRDHLRQFGEAVRYNKHKYKTSRTLR